MANRISANQAALDTTIASGTPVTGFRISRGSIIRAVQKAGAAGDEAVIYSANGDVIYRVVFNGTAGVDTPFEVTRDWNQGWYCTMSGSAVTVYITQPTGSVN